MGCQCALPLVPRVKSHWPSKHILPATLSKSCLSNFSKAWLPAGPPEASLTGLPPAARWGHLESSLPMRFDPRSSGQITLAFKAYFTGHTVKKLFVKLFKSLAPGRAAGGFFNRTATGDGVDPPRKRAANALTRPASSPLPGACVRRWCGSPGKPRPLFPWFCRSPWPAGEGHTQSLP